MDEGIWIIIFIIVCGIIVQICQFVKRNLDTIIPIVILVVAIGALGVGGFYSVRWGYNKYQDYREREKLEEEEEEKRRLESEKEGKIRAFAMKESPNLWKEYQSLGGAIEVQNKKLENLEGELRSFDIDPNTHRGCIDVRKCLEEMKHAHTAVHLKLRDGYFASLVFDSMPDDQSDKVKRCIREAEQVIERYKQLAAERAE